MTAAWPRMLLRALVILFWGAVVAAPFVQHAAITTGHWLRLAISLTLVQAVAVAVMARQSRGAIRVLGLGLAALLFAVAVIRLIRPDGALSALLATSGVSHAILYSSLLLLFSQTLRPGQTPLITTMAKRLQPAFTPAMVVYTRHVTQAWCCFFAGQLLLSGVLFIFAPHATWSLYVNVLDGPLVALMFAAEYGVRRLRFRHVRHVSPLTIIRNFNRTRAVAENG